MKHRSAITGAAFLMATSAIGPGFITQTTLFTQQLLASFGFVILLSVLLDLAAQMNIWRIISVTGKPAQVLANETANGMGHLLTVLIVAGGLVFNIGNIAGCGLGMQLLFGLDASMDYPISGVWISTFFALFIFWIKEAGRAMDWLAKLLGMVMILLTVWVVGRSQPPLSYALYRSFLPEKIDLTAILTLVGGTVGGYISFAGAHRLLDANITGKDRLQEVTMGSVRALLIATLMRTLLFLAALGVILKGGKLDEANPAAAVFQLAAGPTGSMIFGVILWCAAITSVVGSAYTSVSFLRSIHPAVNQHHKWVITLFIVLSSLLFSLYGKPVKLLVFAGAFNGLILPLSLGIMLVSVLRLKKTINYHHPVYLHVIGWLVVGIMTWMGFQVVSQLFMGMWR